MIVKIKEKLYEMTVIRGKEEEIIQVLRGITEFFNTLVYNIEYDLKEDETLNSEIYGYKMYSDRRIDYYETVLSKLGYEVKFEEKKEIKIVQI